MTEFSTEAIERTLFRVGRREFLVGGMAATALFLSGCGEEGQKEHATPSGEFARDPSWQIDFSKHPDGGLDPGQWNIKLGPDSFDGAGLQLYTAHPANLAVRNGRLYITGHQQKMSGREYTSGRIDTKDHTDFGYGRLVVRAQMPSGKGPHAAIWMRRVGDIYGEIDISEVVGVNGERTYPNAHTPHTVAGKLGGLIPGGPGVSVPGMTNGMVEYGLDRSDAGLTFTVNGKVINHIDPLGTDDNTWPFGADDRYYLIMNMSIGGRWGGKDGVDAASAPWQMGVESIKFFPPAEVR